MEKPDMKGWAAAVVVEIGKGTETAYFFNTKEELNSFCFGFEQGRKALLADPHETMTLFIQPPAPPPDVLRIERYKGADKQL